MSPLTDGTSGMGAAFARQHSVKALSCTIPAATKPPRSRFVDEEGAATRRSR
jgi:hypothetical protein